MGVEFQVIQDNEKHFIQVKTLLGIKTFAPEEISAMVRGKMKETTEAYPGKTVILLTSN